MKLYLILISLLNNIYTLDESLYIESNSENKIVLDNKIIITTYQKKKLDTILKEPIIINWYFNFTFINHIIYGILFIYTIFFNKSEVLIIKYLLSLGIDYIFFKIIYIDNISILSLLFKELQKILFLISMNIFFNNLTKNHDINPILIILVLYKMSKISFHYIYNQYKTTSIRMILKSNSKKDINGNIVYFNNEEMSNTLSDPRLYI